MPVDRVLAGVRPMRGGGAGGVGLAAMTLRSAWRGPRRSRATLRGVKELGSIGVPVKNVRSLAGNMAGCVATKSVVSEPY